MTAHPDEVRRELAARWLQKGDSDLKVARVVIETMPETTEAIGFHLQQAAGKYLKAYLTAASVQPPRTHDLQELRTIIATVDRTLAEETAALSALNPFAVIYRYPGPEPTMDAADFEHLEREVRRLGEVVAGQIDAAKDANDADA